jgi:apolipoprotein N-acyltransferase
MNNSKGILIALSCSLLSGLILYLSWPNLSIYPGLFIGFIPLFYSFKLLTELTFKFRAVIWFLSFFLAHYIWIFLSSEWLRETAPKTFYLGTFLESLSISIMAIPALFIARKTNLKLGLAFMVSVFMGFEFLGQSWDLGTPFFILGSGLSSAPYFIQSYEYIGVEGGSLFILLVNLFLFMILLQLLSGHKPGKKQIAALGLAVFPFIISPFLHPEETNDKILASALHYHENTYNEKTHQHPEITINKLFKDSKKSSNLRNSEILVWPEVAISNLGWIHNLYDQPSSKAILAQLEKFPDLTLCTGGYGFALDPNGSSNPYAKFEDKRNFFYLNHNIAVSTTLRGRIQCRGKVLLVPFQERVPYLKTFPFLQNAVEVVGNERMISALETGDEQHKTNQGSTYCPLLCYESIYPLFVAEKSADNEFLVILSNEIWNKDIRGSLQYLQTNIAMAVQDRTAIVRSSNGGVSAIILPSGKVAIQKTDNNPGVISYKIPKKTEATFYENISGILYKLSVIGFFGIFLFSLIKTKKQ